MRKTLGFILGLSLASTSIADAAEIGILLIGSQCNGQTCESSGVPGQKIGQFVIVQPLPFKGGLQLIGNNAARFRLSGTELYVGPAQIPKGQYSVTLKVGLLK